MKNLTVQFTAMLTSLLDNASLKTDAPKRMAKVIGSKRSQKQNRCKTKLGYVGAMQTLKFWIAYNFRCVNCECMLSTYKGFTLGHLMPVSVFVKSEKCVNSSKENIAVQCRECNSAQGDKIASDYFTAEAIARVYAAIAKYDAIPQSDILRFGELASSESSQFAKKFLQGRYHTKYHAK